ncbi:MAG: CHAT domain-containing protein, partial [Bacteroidota bacterium]
LTTVTFLFLLTLIPLFSPAQDCSRQQERGLALLAAKDYLAANDTLRKAYRCWGRYQHPKGRALIPALVQTRLAAAEQFRREADEPQWVRYTTLAAAIASRDSLPQALGILERALRASDTLLLASQLKLHTDYAYRLKQASRFYLAKEHYERARQLALRSQHPAGRFYPYILQPLANIYTRLGEDKTARIILEDCLQHYRDTLAQLGVQYREDPSRKKALLRYLRRTAYIHLELGNAARDEGRLADALAQQDRGLALLRDYANVERMPYVENFFLINRADCLLDQSDTSAARQILQELQGAETLDLEQTFYLREIAAKLALANERYALARREYERARDSAVVYYAPNTQRREIAQLEVALGQTALQQQDWTAAIPYFQRALQRVIPAYQADRQTLPEAQHFYPENVILQGLDGLGQAYQKAYRHRREPKQLGLARKAYELAIEMERLLLDTYLQQSSQLQLLDESSQRHEQLLLLLAEQYRQGATEALATQIFFHFEQSRANLWRRHSADQEALALAHQTLPAPVVQQELRLNEQIKSATERLVQLREEGIPWPDSSYLALEKELLQLRELRESNRRVMAELQPQYGQLLNATEPLALEAVQRALQKSGGELLEFLYGQDSILVLRLAPRGNLDLVVLAKSDRLTNSLNDLLHQISDEEFARSNDRNPLVYRQFTQRAHYLYEQLIAPFYQDHWPEQLYLIPDGPLQALPFELLLPTSVQDSVKAEDLPFAYGQLPYLFRRSSIHYGFAASAIWKPGRTDGRSSEAHYLGLAPDYGNCRLGLTSEASLSHLRAIRDQEGGEADLYTAQVSKGDLLERAQRYEWLHFHGHGLANDEDPMRSALAFSCSPKVGRQQALLYAYEIAGMELPVPLLFLGACNTGRGKMVRGEGVLSLSRAFQLAGVRQVIQTLWEADDLSTARFAQYFFAAGGDQRNDYGTTLQTARQQYLEDPTNNAHPYYWAAFVLTGKEKARVGASWPRMAYTGVALLVSLVLLLAVGIYSRDWAN